MKVGTQHGHSDAILRACAAFGVNNICSGLPSEKMDEAWSVESLSRFRERVASHGISLDMVPLPMSSYEISRAEMPAIYLGPSPERDRRMAARRRQRQHHGMIRFRAAHPMPDQEPRGDEGDQDRKRAIAHGGPRRAPAHGKEHEHADEEQPVGDAAHGLVQPFADLRPPAANPHAGDEGEEHGDQHDAGDGARVDGEGPREDVLQQLDHLQFIDFYHERIGAFHAKVIERWKEMATEAVIADIETLESREERLDALLRHAFGRGAGLEIRMRAWADKNADAARALSDIDRRRREYLEKLLVEAGISPALAATRAQLLYWAYLGAVLGRRRPTGTALDRSVAELKRLGLA